MYKKTFLLVAIFGLFSTICAKKSEEKPIVVLITSYNNAQWYQKNLDSALNQNYKNYRIIYVDDCSPDGTGDLVQQYIYENDWQDMVTLVKNKTRKLKMENFYNAVHNLCEDEEIIIDLDGDDWWVDENVLTKINEAYADPQVWITYGTYATWPNPEGCVCDVIPKRVVRENSYRQYRWVTSQQRTFYAWLFKKIDPEHFKYDGEFLDMACDVAYMFPMLEMAGGRFKYITDVIYVYNRANILNDNKKDMFRQRLLDGYIRGIKRYEKIERSEI